MTQSFNFTNHDLTGIEGHEYALLQDASIEIKQSLEPLGGTNPNVETVMEEKPRQLTPQQLTRAIESGSHAVFE